MVTLAAAVFLFTVLAPIVISILFVVVCFFATVLDI